MFHSELQQFSNTQRGIVFPHFLADLSKWRLLAFIKMCPLFVVVIIFFLSSSLELIGLFQTNLANSIMK